MSLWCRCGAAAVLLVLLLLLLSAAAAAAAAARIGLLLMLHTVPGTFFVANYRPGDTAAAVTVV